MPEVLLRGCATRLVCLGDLVAAAAAGSHELGADAVRPGAAMVLQSQQLPIAHALARLYRTPLRSMVLIHISDGNIWQARAPATARIYSQWRHALRQYWPPDQSGALAASRDRGEVEWFPIGPNPQWVRLMAALRSGEIPVPLASARTHLLSFLGSTDKSDRQARIALVEEALRGLTAVYHRQGNVACYGTGCTDDDYVKATLETALCLQLPGSSVESNRLYEGLEGGCVPVVVTRFGPGEAAVGTTPSYGEAAAAAVLAALAPLANVTGAPPPFIVVQHERELPAALAPLSAHPGGGLDELQRRAREWWERAKRHYADRFAQAVCR